MRDAAFWRVSFGIFSDSNFYDKACTGYACFKRKIGQQVIQEESGNIDDGVYAKQGER